MRKPLHTQRYFLGGPIFRFNLQSLLWVSLVLLGLTAPSNLISQCSTETGVIKGSVFNDKNYNSLDDDSDMNWAGVSIQIIDVDGQVVAEEAVDDLGRYRLSGLVDGQQYTVRTLMPSYLTTTLSGVDHQSDVRIIEAPACDIQFGLANPVYYCDQADPNVAVTCFVKGGDGVNEQMETVVATQFNFNANSSVHKIAEKGSTGAVFGSAWRSGEQALYLASFIKQDAQLKNLPGTIYKSILEPGGYTTQEFVSLENLGIQTGQVERTQSGLCVYGEDVGKKGLGGMEITPDESKLLVVNLFNKSIVIVDILDPKASNTMEVAIPSSCSGGEARPFGISYYEGKYYVTMTCDAVATQSSGDHNISVLEFDMSTKMFTEVFSTSFTREFWLDQPFDNTETQHWLTDIQFSNDGNMILGIADRVSHRYCDPTVGLINQFPDILMVWDMDDNDSQTWELESNGRVGPLRGSGTRNGQGPGGGEFFGEDYWILGPLYHPEVATGTLYILPGSDEVIATVFDPIYNTFAGGFHRYNTTDGSKEGAIELYTQSNQAAFGKGSGLGNIIDMCGPAPIQIGNLVWLDANKNGLQEAGEAGLEGVEIKLYDNNCNEVGSTTTNSLGEYYFDENLNFNSTYIVAITDSRFNAATGTLATGGVDYQLTIANQAIESLNSNAAIYTGSCSLLEDFWTLEVVTGGPGQVNHTFDIGLIDEPIVVIPNDTFDLALIKKIIDPQPAKLSQLIQYEITVFNQGNVTAKNIELVDYMPAGLSFPYILNPGWASINGQPTYTISSELAPGEEVKVNFVMQVLSANGPEDYINYAEIVTATDDQDRVRNDIDSKSDRTPNNDVGGEPDSSNDDKYTDDGTEDEDDHDPAVLPVFDLALIKTTNFDNTVRPNDDITYNIMVVNQGNLAASEITLTDYLPNGLELSPINTTNWITNGNRLDYTISENLDPGQEINVELILRVNIDAADGGLINIAEITGAKGPGGENYNDLDIDSQPDALFNNDNGGEPQGVTDNELDGDGSIDEDDHDPAQLFVFDLALMKVVNNELVTDINQEIIYTFTITNQGEIGAKDVEFLDHLPEGFVFSPAINPGWESLDSRTLKHAVPGTIAPGAEYQVQLTLFIEDFVFGTSLINVAEISSAFDIFDVACKDFDSEPDVDPTNDVGGVVNSPTDNIINDHGAIDEDDNDPAIIRAEQDARVHDLSLDKRGKGHHASGDTVIFELEVFNEGEYTVGQVTITDYLPFFLINIDSDWTPSSFGIETTLSIANGKLSSAGLLPGESAIVELEVLIDQNAFPGYVLNTAEISDVRGVAGDLMNDADIDSNPDNDPRNDTSNNPNELKGGAGQSGLPIEDDRAAFEILICQIEIADTCTCLNDDVDNISGRFSERIVVTSGSDETWYVEVAEDFYNTTSPAPPGAVVPFATGPVAGERLTETVLGGGLSQYTLEGVFEEATSYFVIVKNVEVEAAHSISGGQDCVYDRNGIDGDVNVCVGSLKSYSVINPSVGGVYDWFVDPMGGEIVGPTNRSTVDIQWNAVAGGPYTVWVNEVSPDDCVGPSSIQVTLGDEFAFSVACIQDANVTLEADCETMIVPSMLLVGGPYDYSSYNVELVDEHGHPISGAVLNSTHVGKRIMATVTNSCTGNSCWSWLNVEDKLPPVIECYNDTIRCISLGKFAYPRAVDGCDPSPTISLLDEVIEPLDCDEDYIKRVTRLFVAEDKYGNISDTCEQVIMLERIVLDSIVYPDSLTIANGRALQCNNFAMDTAGFPLPDSFGFPTYQGVPIWPLEGYCNVGVDYEDIELKKVGCVRKIVRRWRVFEWWCTSEIDIISYPQYIEIADTVPPAIVCPIVHHAKANPRSCDADVFIEAPEVSDDCSSVIRIDLVYPGGFIEDYTSRTLTLPLDTSILRFRVYDECYNVDSCDVEVIVADSIPPVAVCDQFTTVGLTDTGIAYIYAHTFDDGSYDNCDLKTMEVKRMDDGAGCGVVADTFGPYVEFCCADVDSSVMVIFRVTDKNGNQNSCMVEVEVQDKIPPKIHCPPNDTINCEVHYDTSDLSIFGEPIVHDNCDYEITEMVFESVDQCREGYIERVWLVRDGNNVATCSQRIYIINDSPFDSTNITWPLDLDTSECRDEFLTPDLLPERHAYPMVDEDFCDLVGITFTDHRFAFTQNNVACYKILRKWKVINWCRFDSTDQREWFHEQVIKVNNDVAPTILGSCDKIEKCIFDDCDFGFIELTNSATDDCTEDVELVWEFHIDLDNDGTVDTSSTGFGPLIEFEGDLKLGEHNIRYVFEDKCGNRTVCTQFFDLVNCKPPSAYCKNGLIVDLVAMDLDGDGECDNEMVEIWAVDLDDNSTSLCDYELCYSFGPDTTNKRLILDCENIGRNEVEICVTDPRGYQSCCNTFIIVQDNNNQDCCPKIIDKDCVIGPGDITLEECDAATDPIDLMSFPNTARCDVDSIQIDYMDEDGTNGDVCLKIKRTWEVTLFLDGEDTTCNYVQCITIDNEFILDSIVWPEDSLILVGCNSSLDTSNTGGVPKLLGEYCDFVTVEWADEQLERMDEVCSYFERTWTVTNKCDNDKEFTFVQQIIFLNQMPPTLTAPADITVDADPGTCSANVTLPPVTFTDCSSGVTIDNDHNGGGENASGVFQVGKTTITFTATDSCGNVATAQTCVTVLDVEAPMLTCPMDVTFDCDVDVDAIVFEGPTAFDNCGAFEIVIDTVYNLNVCNIGTITRRILVTDTTGNADSCLQTITIENQNPFGESNIMWPDSIVMIGACESASPDSTGRPEIDTLGVGCFALNIELRDTMFMDSCAGEPCNVIERKWTITDTCQLDTLGNGVFCFTQRIEIGGAILMITCPTDTTIFCEDGIGDLSLYGDVMVMSECGLDTIIRDSTGALNQCDVGTITRMFTVRDSLGNEMMCSQLITIEIRDPFVEGRITWPMDTVTFESCDSLDLSRTGEPVLDTTGLSCFDLTVTFVDTMYAGTCEGAPCDIIERMWTVVDSCLVDGMGAGVFTFTQIIEIKGGMISVMCPSDTTVSCEVDLSDLSVFGELIVDSPCGLDTVIRDSIIDLNFCNVGTITRSILARDTLGNEVSCMQVITVESSNPFTEMDITWPMDTLKLDGCTSLDPDTLMSRPILDTASSTCFIISVNFSDSSSADCMQDPCLVVTRTWTVVDSCQLDTMGRGVFTFVQRLEVNDTTAPVFDQMMIDTVINSGPDSCNRRVDSLIATATDCSDSITITNNSPFADNGGFNAGGLYPPGVTEFFFFAEDRCCNIDSIPARVEIIDTIAPEVVCTKVIKQLTDSVAGVKFFVTDDIRFASDNCTDSLDLVFSFSKTDLTDTCRVYDCDSVRARGIPNPIFTVRIFVFDEAGNIDSCDVLHQVLDLIGCITTGPSASVSGLIHNRVFTPIEDVTVHMENGSLPDEMTSDLGLYQFTPMPIGGQYVVVPERDVEYLDGVSTKDLLLIQRHLLGIQEFDNPYDLIAADVNRNDDIGVSDILVLRRMLLGYYQSFPHNTSWRFISSDYTFPDPLDPWMEVFPEEYVISELKNHMNIDFKAVKIGDVSGDAGLVESNVTRSNDDLILTVENDGEWIHIVKPEGEAYEGLQFTLHFAPGEGRFEVMYELDGVLSDQNFGFHSLDQGVLTTVIDAEIGIEKQRLFSLPADAISGGLMISSRVTAAKAFVVEGDEVGVKLDYQDAEGIGYALYQNKPNPFKDGTVIGFELPKEQNATLTIMNMSGQVVYSLEELYEKGYNEIDVKAENLFQKGVYYYRLDCDGYSQTMKMIHID